MKENDETGALTETSRKRLINISTDFLVKVFGINANKEERKKVASVIATTFSFLTVVSDKGSMGRLVGQWSSFPTLLRGSRLRRFVILRPVTGLISQCKQWVHR